MHIRQISLDHEKYPTLEHFPFHLEVFQKTRELSLTTPVTFLAGENGTGKSTLLEAVCLKCGIHIWEGPPRVRLNVNPFERWLYRCVSVAWENGPVPGAFFDSRIFINFAHLVDEWEKQSPGILKYYGGESLMEKSHGQSLMAYFTARFQKPGLYLLDEPETALSPATQLKLLELLEELAPKGHAQFIIATHSPILMSLAGATIYNFDTAPVSRINYQDTEHYRVFRDFFLEKEEQR